MINRFQNIELIISNDDQLSKRIDSQKSKILAEVLGTTVLKSLDLSYNEVEGAGLRSILEKLRKNINLQVINLFC